MLRLYHFISANFGLMALQRRRLKIARLHELNDPFEFLAADLSDRKRRKALRDTKAQLSKSNGLLCFSKTWRNPVLWGHYAEKHQGLCLGFDVPATHAQQVAYVNSRFSWPEVVDQPFMRQLLFTKFSHWNYEDEYRVYAQLDTEENGLFFAEFSEHLALRQVIVGCESSVSRAQVREALSGHSDGIEMFKARAAFTSFRIVRTRNENLRA